MESCMDNKKEQLIEILSKFTSDASKYLPDDVYARLQEMREEEESPMACEFYDAMFKNMEMAKELDRPICQDTGILQYIIQAGTAFPLLDELEDCLREAARRATQETPLRPNVVEIFADKNTGTNMGTRIPWIDWELIPHSDEVRIYLYMAGGGCSLPGFAKVFPPLEGLDAVRRAVYDQVSTLGVNACPPLLVGIGLAGSMDVAAKLAKKAILRPIGSQNADPEGAKLEEQIEEDLNQIGIGPGGVTGRHSVMGVHIEQAGRHPASLAMGLYVSCWVHRRALIRIKADLSCEVLSHQKK